MKLSYKEGILTIRCVSSVSEGAIFISFLIALGFGIYLSVYSLEFWTIRITGFLFLCFFVCFLIFFLKKERAHFIVIDKNTGDIRVGLRKGFRFLGVSRVLHIHLSDLREVILESTKIPSSTAFFTLKIFFQGRAPLVLGTIDPSLIPYVKETLSIAAIPLRVTSADQKRMSLLFYVTFLVSLVFAALFVTFSLIEMNIKLKSNPSFIKQNSEFAQ